MSDVTRVEFDATLEEIVDVDMRLVMSTKTYRRGRRQSQWIVGVIIAGVVAVALQDHLPLTAIAALTALSGFLSGSLYGVFYETWVKQSYTLMVHELYADATTVPCAFELRDDAFWGKTGHIEVAFPWSEGVALNDRGDCIEVWCHPTLAVIRNRAFRSDSERHVFLHTARSKSS